MGTRICTIWADIREPVPVPGSLSGSFKLHLLSSHTQINPSISLVGVPSALDSKDKNELLTNLS